MFRRSRGNPVMLNGNAAEVWTGAENLHTQGSFQVSGRDAQSCGAPIDLAEAPNISENCAANAGAR